MVVAVLVVAVIVSPTEEQAPRCCTGFCAIDVACLHLGSHRARAEVLGRLDAVEGGPQVASGVRHRALRMFRCRIYDSFVRGCLE